MTKLLDLMWMEVDGVKVDAIANQVCHCGSSGYQFLQISGAPFLHLPMYPQCPKCGCPNVVMKKDILWQSQNIRVR